jgi:MFS family permease
VASGATSGGAEASTALAPEAAKAQPGVSVVLLTLASAQFLMTLDASVMNVSIASVAQDVGTDVAGIQSAITAYTLVMAALMLAGAKVGTLIGRKRAFSIGCVIYACGSFTTSIAPNLPVLLFGWSFLEGVGAALILPAIVALVAANFGPERRPSAYGLVAAAGAIAVALGPLIGGAATTYASWRWVFVGEVVLAGGILLLARRQRDAPTVGEPTFDYLGATLSAAGIGLAVFGVLRAGEWGWVAPKPDAPSLFGVSAVIWLVLAGVFVLWLFLRWQARCERVGREPLVAPALFHNRRLRGGLLMFFFQYLVQAGIFFLVPIFLSVALGLSAIQTGLRVMPLSVTLLAAAIGVPRLFPHASPRRVVRLGLLALLAGAVILMAALSPTAGAEIVLWPMLLIGLGIGMLASQLGAVTVSAVPDEQSPEVGGLQNTMTNLGASLGTALAGSILIATLTTSFLTTIGQDPKVPARLASHAQATLASGVPFVSDPQVEDALDEAGVPARHAESLMEAYRSARVDGLQSALAILALATLVALFVAQGLPREQARPPDGDVA